jgi:predicted ribosome quality control (RQC) complex YloA/Tae2 family protein
VSNAIRYDSLLVRELACELDGALAGARLHDVLLDRERLRCTLVTGTARRADAAPPSLLWQLHPMSGHLTPAPADAGGARVPLRPRSPITAVTAPPDDRIIVLELAPGDAAAGLARRIIIELVTNQWNVVAVGADERIIAVLRERTTRERTLRAGVPYVPPPPTARPGARAPLALDEWRSLLGPVAPGERLAALPRLVAYASPLNAAWIVGAADVSDDPVELDRAYDRWLRLADGDMLEAVLLPAGAGWQPYVAHGAGPDAAPSLLRAFEEAAARMDAAPPTEAGAEDALAAVAERIDALERRVRRLQEEQQGASAEATRLRQQADVLLSQLHLVPKGAALARLDDLQGGTLDIELDPAATPAANARRFYDVARRRDRAAARVPPLLRRAAGERARLEELAARVRDGSATAEELARLQRRRGGTQRDSPALPWRAYRTSRGLEVRVGRGSRANDELTFRHSHRDDIWLHARDVGGAHVILRWGRPDENPPAADIAEAAVLAALHSRARTSGTVAVDWTRRKHVRKPRKAAPGLVLPERVRTVFVEPDPAVEEKLRVDDVA